MAFCRTLSDPKSEDQETDYQQLIRYAIELNKAHGNRLETDIDLDGTLIPSQLGYTEPFDQASTSLKRVGELSEMVTRPSISKPKDVAFVK